MSPLPRLTSPCSENLDAMEKTARGSFCSTCQHDVVDLRATPRKKALKVLSELRAKASDGRVCVRAMFSSDGTPVFRPDAPSMFTRFAAPIAMASTLAACAPSTRAEPSTDVVAVVSASSGDSNEGATGSNRNGQQRVVTAVPTEPTPQPVLFDGPVEAAGGLAWAPGLD